VVFYGAFKIFSYICVYKKKKEYMDKVLQYKKVLQSQLNKGIISNKKYKKELKWIRKNITIEKGV
jgi:hypothetical protein